MSEQQLKMTVDEVVNRVTDVLNEIINVEGGGTKIRYGESGEKFYLTRITGGESSINTLVQLIMYNEGIFKWILSEEQYSEIEEIIGDGNTGTYNPDALYDFLSQVYYYSIAFVGTKLSEYDADVKETFIEEGFDILSEDDYEADAIGTILLSKIKNDCTTVELPFEDDELTVESISDYVCLITNSIFNEGLPSSCNPDEQDDYHQVWAYFNDDNSIADEFLIVVPSDSKKITGKSLSSKNHNERSLEALIFSVLYAKRIYEHLLSNEQFERLEKMLELYKEEESDSNFNGEQDSILFVPQLTDENYSELMPLLSQIYLNVINFVKNKLTKLGYQSDKIFDDYVENHAPFSHHL